MNIAGVKADKIIVRVRNVLILFKVSSLISAVISIFPPFVSSLLFYYYINNDGMCQFFL